MRRRRRRMCGTRQERDTRLLLRAMSQATSYNIRTHALRVGRAPPRAWQSQKVQEGKSKWRRRRLSGAALHSAACGVRCGAVRSESDVHRSVARCWACLRELGAGILGGRHCNCMSVAQGPRHTIGCVTLRPQGRGRHMRAVRCTRRVSVHSSSSSSVEVVPPYLTGRSRCHRQ